MTSPVPPGELAEKTTSEIISDFTTTDAPGVVVDSPPGAGKSTLVVRVTCELAGALQPVKIVAQTNGQVDDLTLKVAQKLPRTKIGRLSASDYRAVPAIQLENVKISSKVDDLRDCYVVIGTTAKWNTIDGDYEWPWAIVDEAYQMRSDMLLRLASMFQRILFVGDPGQLDPFSTVEVDRWAGLPWDPMQSAVAVLLRNNPQLRVHQLPLSWRLPPSATGVVQRAFYPFTPFGAGTRAEQRGVELPTRGIGATAVDDVLAEATRSGWGFYELPHRNTVRTDTQAVAACADIAVRLLQRGTETFCETAPNGRRLEPGRIAIGAAHRDQVAAINHALRGHGEIASGIRVDTANRLQGAEYDFTVMLHPLSGRIDATAFHLETGRLCVLASRHRHGCIVVGRAGIPELLDAHPSNEPMHLNAMIKFPDGWEANQAVLAHLAAHRVRAKES